MENYDPPTGILRTGEISMSVRVMPLAVVARAGLQSRLQIRCIEDSTCTQGEQYPVRRCSLYLGRPWPSYLCLRRQYSSCLVVLAVLVAMPMLRIFAKPSNGACSACLHYQLSNHQGRDPRCRYVPTLLSQNQVLHQVSFSTNRPFSLTTEPPPLLQPISSSAMRRNIYSEHYRDRPPFGRERFLYTPTPT